MHRYIILLVPWHSSSADAFLTEYTFTVLDYLLQNTYDPTSSLQPILFMPMGMNEIQASLSDGETFEYSNIRM